MQGRCCREFIHEIETTYKTYHVATFYHRHACKLSKRTQSHLTNSEICKKCVNKMKEKNLTTSVHHTEC